MFKNFDKVFGFTFKNQAKTKSYILLTVIMALALLILPALILKLIDNSKKKDEGIKDSGIQYVYVVNEEAPTADFSFLNMTGVEYYKDIKYMNCDTVDEALDKAEGSENTVVLNLYKKDGEILARIILPNNSNVDEKHAGYFDDFIEQQENFVAILASGISMTDLANLSQQTEYKVYSSKGYANGESLYDDEASNNDIIANTIKPIFNYVIVFASIMVLYFMILSYGNGISMNVVMEKASKLMDTMLVSIKPEALVFGKLLGVLAAGLLQLFIWIVCAVIGFTVAFKMLDSAGSTLAIFSFFKMMGELGIFSIPKVILAIITIVFGILLYASLSCFAGAISNNREEAASNNTIFTMVLLISFYIVLFCGLGAEGGVMPVWMMFIPPVAAMVLPASLVLGTINLGLGLLAVALLVVCSLVITIISGKLYKMMSLYKGNGVKIGKALKMLFSNQ